MDKASQIEWLAKDEEAATESVSYFELGVFSRFDNKLLFAKITESTTTVWLPRDLYTIANAQVGHGDMGRQHLIRPASLSNVFHKVLPIIVTKKTRKDFQSAVSCLVSTFDVTPQTFQRRWTHGFSGSLKDSATQEDEVRGRFHLAFQALFDAFLEF